MFIPTGLLSWQREIPPPPAPHKGAAAGEAMRGWLVPRDLALLRAGVLGAAVGGGWKQQERHILQGASLGQDVSSVPQTGEV